MGIEAKVEGRPSIDLEKIAKQLGNMEEAHKMDQIMGSVMDAFINFKGVKYKDPKTGVEMYKTNFDAAETNKIADAIFDKLLYHVHLRRYPTMSVEEFNKLKTHPDPEGNLYADGEVERALGISRAALKKILLRERDHLTTDTVANIAANLRKQHEDITTKKITESIDEEHKDYLKDFINKYVTEKGLSKKDYKIKKGDTKEDLIDKYKKIAVQFYKK
jgi:hypothetical protein